MKHVPLLEPGLERESASEDHAYDEHGLARRPHADTELDITPMIDITFLLLIYFLVASVPDQQTAIRLPKADHGTGVSQVRAVVITVGETAETLAPIYLADGKIEEDRIAGTAEQQADRIREAVLDEYPEKTDVIIKADRSVPSREVFRVMKAASRVEGVHLHLAVLEKE